MTGLEDPARSSQLPRNELQTIFTLDALPHNQQDTHRRVSSCRVVVALLDVLALSDGEINRWQKLMKAFTTVLSLMVISTLIASVVFLVL